MYAYMGTYIYRPAYKYKYIPNTIVKYLKGRNSELKETITTRYYVLDTVIIFNMKNK